MKKLIHSLSALFQIISIFFILNVSASEISVQVIGLTMVPVEYNKLMIVDIFYSTTEQQGGMYGFLYNQQFIKVSKSLSKTPAEYVSKKSELGKLLSEDILVDISSGKLKLTAPQDGKKMSILVTRGGRTKKAIPCKGINTTLVDGDVISLVIALHQKSTQYEKLVLPMYAEPIIASLESNLKIKDSSTIRIMTFKVGIAQKENEKTLDEETRNNQTPLLSCLNEQQQSREKVLVKPMTHGAFQDKGLYFNVVGLPDIPKKFKCEFESLPEDLFKSPFSKITIGLTSIKIEHQFSSKNSKGEVEWLKCLTNLYIDKDQLAVYDSNVSPVAVRVLSNDEIYRSELGPGLRTMSIKPNDRIFITGLQGIVKGLLDNDHDHDNVKSPEDWNDIDLEQIGLDFFNNKIIEIVVKNVAIPVVNDNKTHDFSQQPLISKSPNPTLNPSNAKTSTINSNIENPNDKEEHSTLETFTSKEQKDKSSSSELDVENSLMQQELDVLAKRFVELSTKNAKALTRNQNQPNSTNSDQKVTPMEQQVNDRDQQTPVFVFGSSLNNSSDSSISNSKLTETKSPPPSQNQSNNINNDQGSNSVELVDDKNATIDQQTPNSTFTSDNTPIFDPLLADFEIIDLERAPAKKGPLAKKLDFFFENLDKVVESKGKLILKKRKKTTKQLNK